MLVINGIQQGIANKKFSKFKKLFLFVCIWIGNMYYNTQTFISNRQPTLYDLFDVPRDATFEEIKKAKDPYL